MRKSMIVAVLTVMTLLGLAPAAVAQVFPPGQGPDDVYAGGVVVTQAPQALAFTGSSNSTPSMVYIGIAAVTIGLVLFVATRRRRSVLDQA